MTDQEKKKEKWKEMMVLIGIEQVFRKKEKAEMVHMYGQRQTKSAYTGKQAEMPVSFLTEKS